MSFDGKVSYSGAAKTVVSDDVMIARIVVDHVNRCSEFTEKCLHSINHSVKSSVINKKPKHSRHKMSKSLDPIIEIFSYKAHSLVEMVSHRKDKDIKGKKCQPLTVETLLNSLNGNQEDPETLEITNRFSGLTTEESPVKRHKSDLQKYLFKDNVAMLKLEKEKKQERNNRELANLINDLSGFVDSGTSVPNDFNYQWIANRINDYEQRTDTKLNDRSEERTYLNLNGISQIILDVMAVLNDQIQDVLQKFRDHIVEVGLYCRAIDSIRLYNESNHKLDQFSDFTHETVNENLVPIVIDGDGNCLWSSVSVSLFGHFSMMESLRLLTAFTLLTDPRFKTYITEQKDRFGYGHELSLESLVRTSAELHSWGDELHIMALSLSLCRPIYSYGSLKQLYPFYSGYDAVKRHYETEDLINHYRYIADETHENETPILLYYNGRNHYGCVLPTKDSVVPLVPKTQLLEPIYKSEVKGSNEEDGPQICPTERLSRELTAKVFDTSDNVLEKDDSQQTVESVETETHGTNLLNLESIWEDRDPTKSTTQSQVIELMQNINEDYMPLVEVTRLCPRSSPLDQIDHQQADYESSTNKEKEIRNVAINRDLINFQADTLCSTCLNKCGHAQNQIKDLVVEVQFLRDELKKSNQEIDRMRKTLNVLKDVVNCSPSSPDGSPDNSPDNSPVT